MTEANNTTQVAFRLSTDLLRQIDQLALSMKESGGQLKATRADAVRYLLQKGLEAEARAARNKTEHDRRKEPRRQ